MNIKCHTNIDRWKHTAWPNEFVAIPLVGDYVEGIGPGDYRPRLKVHSVTHTVTNSFDRGAMVILELG
jgi:hypothetical protein